MKVIGQNGSVMKQKSGLKQAFPFSCRKSQESRVMTECSAERAKNQEPGLNDIVTKLKVATRKLELSEIKERLFLCPKFRKTSWVKGKDLVLLRKSCKYVGGKGW